VVEGVVMLRFCLVLACASCMPDLSGLPADPPCTEALPLWDADTWRSFRVAPDAESLGAWEDVARCRVHRMRVLARTMTTSTVEDVPGIKAQGAQLQLQANELKMHLLALQSNVWRDCACTTPMQCTHRPALDGDEETTDALCDGARDRAVTLVGILDHMIDHAGRVALESDQVNAQAHAEHVLNCIQAGGQEDWDLDADAEQVCVGALNDYGLVGSGPGDLIRLQVLQVQQGLLP
jgi:hypothetical protein